MIRLLLLTICVVLFSFDTLIPKMKPFRIDIYTWFKLSTILVTYNKKDMLETILLLMALSLIIDMMSTFDHGQLCYRIIITLAAGDGVLNNLDETPLPENIYGKNRVNF